MSQIRLRGDELGGSDGARTFIGADHDDVPISLFIIDRPPGSGPALHRHPYPEVFVVHAGQAEFEVDGERLGATAGDVAIAPAGAAHKFVNVGTESLRMTAIHTAARMETEWLEPQPAS
jgi:quercetin dioxygenase-like cupin family protein